MDSCVLAETGTGFFVYLLLATTLLLLGAITVKKTYGIKLPSLLLALVLVGGVALAPMGAYAQTAEDCPDEAEATPGLVDDFAAMQIPDGDTLFSNTSYVAILGNDLPPSGDPYNWETIDLDLNTPGQQTSFNLPHPDNATVFCGEIRVDTFGILVVELLGDCHDEGFANILEIPSDYTIPPFQYTVQTVSGSPAPAPATVTINLQIDPVAGGVVVANDDLSDDCTMPFTIDVLGNDTTSAGSLNPLTVDLNPSLPGRQTSVSITTENDVFTATVDDAGNVTISDESGDGYCPPDFYYTVRNTDGTLSNVARIGAELLDG